ncbi:MAG: transglutaminase domain-containing protein [Myxococcales bacterium]|nr:transglutaminase domain-containing protein [Myxococcales bacterium]
MLVVLWLLLGLVSGCAGRSQGALTPLEPGQLDARAALERPGLADDPIEAAQALAEAELELGLPDRAAEAMGLALHRAESAWWMARLDADTDAIADARRRLDRTAESARRWAQRTDDPVLMVRAIMLHPHPRRHRRALRRALTRTPDPAWVTAERLQEVLGDDPASRIAIARTIAWYQEEREQLGLGTLPAELAVVDLLHDDLMGAIDRLAPETELRARAEAMLEVDPWHVEAMIVGLALDEIAAGTLPRDPLLLEDLAGRTLDWLESGHARQARLSLRAEAFPRSAALPTALAWTLLQRELVGDAHGVLEAMPEPADPRAARLREQLRAMTAARRGEVASFEHWRVDGRVRSWSIDTWLHEFEEPAYGELRIAARLARRRLAEVAPPPPGSIGTWRVLLDDSVSERARGRARDALPGSRMETRGWEAICREHALDPDACASRWAGEDPLLTIQTAGRSRHFHPIMLSGVGELGADDLLAIAPVLDAYAGTVIEATPEGQIALLRLELARGDHAAVRARLERHGALLPIDERAHAWLVLDDLEAGRLSLEAATSAWVPGFRLDELDVEPEIMEPPSTRVDRYTLGMSAAFRNQHQRALELLLPVLDEVPDEVMTAGLAQAALAAHRAGDAEQRDRLRHRLRAVDPHGIPFALLESHLAAGAGLHEDARRALAHALRWHPDWGGSLYQGLVTPDAGVPEAEALAFLGQFASYPASLQQELPTAVRRGQVESLATLALARPTGTPEDAWQVQSSWLAHLPSVAMRAVAHGEQRISEATDLAAALHWAGATIEKLEASEIASPRMRRKLLWLALLVGRSEAGLVHARARDPEGRFGPISEGDAAILLLRSRGAGEIDDALAWDLWRWVYGSDEEASARVEALLLDPPHGTILEDFACGELTTREELAPAFEVCARAWQAQPGSASLAVSQMFLALNHPQPELGEALGRELMAGPSLPRFLDDPGLATGESLAQVWHQNRAVWHGAHGEHEQAAEAWEQAYALGLDDETGTVDGYAQLRFRGAQLRALTPAEDATPRQLQVRRATMALAAAEPVVAEAYAEAAAAVVPAEPGALTRDELMMPDRLRHLARWAAADLEAGRLPPEQMSDAIDQVLSTEVAETQALHQAHPESSLAQLARIDAHRQLDELEPARELAEALLRRHPDDPLAASVAVPLRVAAEDHDGARAVYDAAVAAHPGDALLLYIDAPESITGPRDGVPSWVRDPASYDARIAAVTDEQVLDLMPLRHASDERAAELFVPRAWSPVGDRPLRFTDEHGARVLVLSSPRASRCQGPDCARDLLDGVGGEGRTRQWSRQTTLAGVEATQALFTNAEEVLVAWVLPSGGRIFTLVVAAPVERFDQIRAALVTARDGFRPLDAVLPAGPAEQLRVAGPTLLDGWRLRARREQLVTPGEGCPVAQTLAALAHDHQRAELLVDLWLATADDEDRRVLLRCTSPRHATARRLALVTLLDEDPRVHAFGRRAVLTHATRVEADLRTIASTPLTPPVSAPDYLTRDDLPTRGLVETLGALPLPAARRVSERLLASADLRDRALAWAALRLRPELASDAAVDEALAGDRSLVNEAAFLLSDRARPEDLERLRTHLDALPPAADEPAQERLQILAVALATTLDPQDGPRLEAAVAKVRDGDDPERAERLRKELRSTAEDHARGVELVRDPSAEITGDDGRSARWHDQRIRRELAPRSVDELRERRLAELLPGRHWTFARLAAPGLFSSTVADVVERLTTGDESIDPRLSELTSRVLREGGFAALSSSGGLDASKPIECAQPAHGYGWLCTARVSDREALLRVLGQRAHGDDAGLSLPMSVATTAGIVPVALSLMPAILHPLVYPDDDDDDGPSASDVAAERVRTLVRVGDMELERYSIVDASTERISIDSERYLFLGDRLWVFSTDDAMERVMLRHEGPALADDPEFGRLTAGWKDGAALQAVALGHAWPLAEGGASMEVVLDEGGLHFRYAGAFESEQGVADIGPAVAQLPEGAITIFAHGLGRADSWTDEELEAKGPDATRVPPLPVLASARGVAFGWYLEDGDHLWRRWLAVAPLDEGLRKALRTHRTPPGRGRSRRHGGLCYRERSGYLLVGECTLVDRSAAGPEPPPPSRDELRLGHGTFDGAIAAERLPGLGGLPLDKKATLRIVAPLLGIVTDLRVQARWVPADHMAVLEGRVGLRLRPPGDRSRVIDDWLASTEAVNAATLPRRVRSEELEAPLRYLIEVPDAEAFVRDTLADSPRVEAEVLSPTRVRLTVSPVPAKPRPVPLDEDERERLTKHTTMLRSDDPRVRKVARSIAPKGATPRQAAEAISAWVHERLTYEVTPRTLDGAEILEAGRGDCSEYATLTVTMLRAVGVPAEVRDGMAASGDEMVAHAWVAYHDGTAWHELDPTWGRTTASAGHLEMSVLDVLALISLGRLEVVQIDTP